MFNCTLCCLTPLFGGVNVGKKRFSFCCDFLLGAVAIFWAMLLVRIYPGRATKLPLLSYFMLDSRNIQQSVASTMNSAKKMGTVTIYC